MFQQLKVPVKIFEMLVKKRLALYYNHNFEFYVGTVPQNYKLLLYNITLIRIDIFVKL